jgi:hypothetical protein
MNLLHSPRLVYHHLPKCGGTSILKGIALCYYPLRLALLQKRGFPGLLNAKAATTAAARLSRDPFEMRRLLLGYHVERNDSPLVFGHYPFCEKVHEVHHGYWHFVSLFRDPLERWYSEYFWNRYKDHDYAKTELEIEEYLESTQGRAGTRLYINYFCNAAAPAGPVTDQELKTAIANTDRLDVAGTMDNMPAFLSAMKEKFGRKPYLLKLNKSPAPKEKAIRPDEESDVHKKLLTMLEADQEIYQHILERTGQHQ